MKTLGLMLAAGLALTAVACGDSDEKHPSLAISSPAAGSEVALGTDADKSVTIGVTLENFTLMAPGSCKGAEYCGHLHVNIDGDTCNAMGMPYNNAATDAAKVIAKFARCAMDKQVGDHKITISAHDDGHADVVHDGAPLKADISFKTK